jgi:hypothetical protein
LLPKGISEFSGRQECQMTNAFTRGTAPGRARDLLQRPGSFRPGHAKVGGRKKGTPNAISPRARKAIAAAAKRIARGTNLNRRHWQQVIDNNPLITEALEHQGKFTLGGAPRSRSRAFHMQSFCQDLGAVAMRAIQTDQFVDQDLVQCLTLLAVRDPTAFGKFLALTLPQQTYLAARPYAEVPRDAVNPGQYRRPPIPEWGLGLDQTLNAYTPVPLDPALTPQGAHHELCGSPLHPGRGWDWKFDNATRRYRPIALRPKTPIPEWTLDPKRATPFPVDPRLTPDQAYHAEYGSPLFPAPGWKWQFDSRTQRLIPAILDEPSRHCERRLYRWHPDEGHFSLVREDDDDGEEYDLYEYDAERLLFKRHQPRLEPLTPTKPRRQKIEPKPEKPRRRRFFVRLPNGTYAIIRGDECSLADIYEYDPKNNQFIRIAK